MALTLKLPRGWLPRQDRRGSSSIDRLMNQRRRAHAASYVARCPCRRPRHTYALASGNAASPPPPLRPLPRPPPARPPPPVRAAVGCRGLPLGAQ